ncbi:MAG: DUF2490 domain-containing protein [Lentimicrobiaceae bacterium]|nr:DUF2490 domain-containing protein [Lentimicrobiaceae bacterium]
MGRSGIILFLLAFSNLAWGQHAYQAGVLPGISLSKGLGKGWGINLRAETRQKLVEGIAGEGSDMGYAHLLADYSLILSRRSGLNNRLSAGYLLRHEPEQIRHRLLQQYTIVTQFSKLRLAHRIASDQTFGGEDPLSVRFRYRLGWEQALRGQSIDPGELYFKLSNEYLFEIEQDEHDLEMRWQPFLGYYLSDNNKLEGGLDYRLSSLLNAPGRSRIWLSINWLISIK